MLQALIPVTIGGGLLVMLFGAMGLYIDEQSMGARVLMAAGGVAIIVVICFAHFYHLPLA